MDTIFTSCIKKKPLVWASFFRLGTRANRIASESKRGRIRYTKRDGGVGTWRRRRFTPLCVSFVFQSGLLSSSDVNKVFCPPPLVPENFHPSGYSSSVRWGFSPIDALSLFLPPFFSLVSYLPFRLLTCIVSVSLAIPRPSIAIIDPHWRRRRCAPIVITPSLVHSRGHFLADPTLSYRISAPQRERSEWLEHLNIETYRKRILRRWCCGNQIDSLWRS